MMESLLTYGIQSVKKLKIQPVSLNSLPHSRSNQPIALMSCIVGMPKNLKVKVNGDSIYVESNKPLENTTIQINIVNNLTLMEEDVVKISAITKKLT